MKVFQGNLENITRIIRIRRKFYNIFRLTNPSGAMKVIWNACYALGNILRNNFLFENADGSEWQVSK